MARYRYEATKHPQIKKYVDKRTGAGRYLVRYRTDQHKLTMKHTSKKVQHQRLALVLSAAAKTTARLPTKSKLIKSTH